ncbi:MAG: energy transducer TonB [Erythrobacter sp.]
MAYTTQANRPNVAALAGALAIPALAGAVLVAGLAITVTQTDEDDAFTGWTLRDPPPPEPLPEPEPQTRTEADHKATQQVPTQTQTVPRRPDTAFTFDAGNSTPIGPLPTLGDSPIGSIDPVDFGNPDPLPTKTLDPVGASPKGNPGGWISNRDYRSSWINRGYAGTAGFALTIDAKGRIAQCAITRSTGHSVLDKATCDLLERRAKFNPAKDSEGKAVSGTYRNSVTWKIPD